MKIFLNNINKKIKNNNSEIITKRVKQNFKLVTAYTKEWKNIAYFYNKNTLKNISVDYLRINYFITHYFNLFIKEFIFNNRLRFFSYKWKIKKLYKREIRILNKIWVSKPEIKYTNSIIKITLFIINRHKLITKNKFKRLNTMILKRGIRRLYLRYYNKRILNKFFIKLRESMSDKISSSTTLTTKSYIKEKLANFYIYLTLRNLYSEKLIKRIILSLSKRYLKKVRKYEHLHNLNQYKLDQSILLPKLSSIIQLITGKKVEYNIINLKSIIFHPDIFTNILARLIKRRKKIAYSWNMTQVLAKVPRLKKKTYKQLIKVEEEKEKEVNLKRVNKAKNFLFKTFKNLHKRGLIKSALDETLSLFRKESNIPLEEKMIICTSLLYKYKKNNINNKMNNKFEKLITIIKNRTLKRISFKTIFKSIHYKLLNGVRIEVKGRLTKRYRADRAVYRFRSKGGLRNTFSSYEGISVPLYRGNTNTNTSYSLSKSKRNVGSFAVKGWIAGK